MDVGRGIFLTEEVQNDPYTFKQGLRDVKPINVVDVHVSVTFLYSLSHYLLMLVQVTFEARPLSWFTAIQSLWINKSAGAII